MYMYIYIYIYVYIYIYCMFSVYILAYNNCTLIYTHTYIYIYTYLRVAGWEVWYAEPSLATWCSGV